MRTNKYWVNFIYNRQNYYITVTIKGIVNNTNPDEIVLALKKSCRDELDKLKITTHYVIKLLNISLIDTFDTTPQ